MKIRQLSIFLENRFGRLAGVTKALGDAGIDILAISVADTADFGILRLIVKDIDKASTALNSCGVVSRVNTVSVVEIGKEPGSLAKTVAILESAGVNVEYMYAIAQSPLENPLMVFRFAEAETAAAALEKAGIRVLSEEELMG